MAYIKENLRGIDNMVFLNDFKTENNSYQEALRKAICYCKDNNEKLLTMKQGKYDFYEEGCFTQYLNITNHGYPGEKNIAALIKDMEDFCIDGNGSELNFYGVICPFVIDNSQNIRIKNFNLNTEDVFNFQARVVESTKDYVLCSHNYDKIIFEDGQIFVSENKFSIANILEYNYETYAPESGLGNQDLGVHSKELTYEKVSETEFKVYGHKVNPKVNNYLIMMFCPRIAAGIFINNSKNISVENTTLYNGFGMGCVAQRSENIYLHKFNTQHKEGKYFSINADATHFTNCKGLVMLEDCHFTNQLDDGLNIHGIYTKITKKAEDCLTVKYMHPAALGIDVFTDGSVIRAVKETSLLPTGGEQKIIKTEKIDLETLKIYLSSTDGFEVGNLIENMTWNAELVVRNCSFKSNKCRGILVATNKKVVIENNYFHNLGCGIKFECDGKYWFESGATSDITIINNTFDHCIYGKRDKAVIEFSSRDEVENGKYYHNKVKISKNTFNTGGEQLFYADNVKEFYFTDNEINSADNKKPYTIINNEYQQIDI